MEDPLDGRIGEAWSGEVPDGSHINVVLARRGSPTAAAAAGALASPRPGHLPFLACLSPGVVVRPTTIVVNKSPIEDGSKVGPITWGAAQLGIDPDGDETAVKAANRAAMRDAIADALRPPGGDDVRALAGRREEAANAYYTGG